MVAKSVTGCAAEMLAISVDEALADRWTDVGSTLAVAGMDGRPPTAEDLVSLGRDPVQALRSVPKTRCVAACLTSVGSAVRLDLPTTEHHLPVRATVAVTCCDTITLLRHRGGGVQRSVRSRGAVIEMLRTWADLRPCEGCSPTVGANSKGPTQGW